MRNAIPLKTGFMPCSSGLTGKPFLCSFSVTLFRLEPSAQAAGARSAIESEFVLDMVLSFLSSSLIF